MECSVGRCSDRNGGASTRFRRRPPCRRPGEFALSYRRVGVRVTPASSRRCRARLDCGNRLLGADDDENQEKDGYDQGPHSREDPGESSNCGQRTPEGRRPWQQERSGGHQEAATDERGEPEPEATVPSADEADSFRDTCDDEQATKGESKPPGPAMHLRTVAAPSVVRHSAAIARGHAELRALGSA